MIPFRPSSTITKPAPTVMAMFGYDSLLMMFDNIAGSVERAFLQGQEETVVELERKRRLETGR